MWFVGKGDCTSNIVHLCLRNDCETLLSDKERKYIEYLLKKENLEFKYISTLSDIDSLMNIAVLRIVSEFSMLFTRAVYLYKYRNLFENKGGE